MANLVFQFFTWAVQIFTPAARNSASTTSIPFLSIVRNPAWLTRSRTQRFPPSTQERWDCRRGKERRGGVRFAGTTLLPFAGCWPVTSHPRAKTASFRFGEPWNSRGLYQRHRGGRKHPQAQNSQRDTSQPAG